MAGDTRAGTAHRVGGVRYLGGARAAGAGMGDAVCDVAGERASNLVRKAREFLGSNRYREDRAEAGKKSIFVQHLFVHDLNRGYASVSNRSACYFRPDRTSGGHALSSCEYFCAVFHSDIGLFSGHAAASIQPDAWRGRQGRT